MTQLKKYLWLIDTIRRHGKISHKELSCEWERNKDMSDYKPLHRGTFNRWREAIYNKLGIRIECQAGGGYLYYIANPEDIDDNRLKNWLMDTFSTGSMVGDYLSLKNRILVDEIPSGRIYLHSFLEAMKANRVVDVKYHSFRNGENMHFAMEPFCVKLFEGRWYVLGHPLSQDNPQLFGLDRIESLSILDTTFKLPAGFCATEYFTSLYGIVADGQRARRVVVRAYKQHKNYVDSLPMHHTQRMIEDCGEYADFEMYVAPTFDFIMRLLHDGAWLEVISPASLRRAMKGWISDMYDLYEND